MITKPNDYISTNKYATYNTLICLLTSCKTVVGLYVFLGISHHIVKISVRSVQLVWRDLMTNRQIATSHFHISRHYLKRLLCTKNLKIMFGWFYTTTLFKSSSLMVTTLYGSYKPSLYNADSFEKAAC